MKVFDEVQLKEFDDLGINPDVFKQSLSGYVINTIPQFLDEIYSSFHGLYSNLENGLDYSKFQEKLKFVLKKIIDLYFKSNENSPFKKYKDDDKSLFYYLFFTEFTDFLSYTLVFDMFGLAQYNGDIKNDEYNELSHFFCDDKKINFNNGSKVYCAFYPDVSFSVISSFLVKIDSSNYMPVYLLKNDNGDYKVAIFEGFLSDKKFKADNE